MSNKRAALYVKSAPTHGQSKLKSASFGKLLGGVAGMWLRSTTMRASQAPRDETGGLASNSMLKDASRHVVMAWALTAWAAR